MVEEWKPITNFEQYYEISSLGRLRSLDRVVFNYKNQPRKLKGRMLSPGLDKDGYLIVTLNCNSSRKTVKVHRLVAAAFIPNPNSKEEVNHLNGIRDDNRVSNLEWATRTENVQHSWDTGLCTSFGEEHPSSKLLKSQVLEILKLKQDGNTLEFIANKYNVGFKCISKIVTGRRWSKVTGITSPDLNKRANCKITSSMAAEIYELSQTGEYTDTHIAERYGVCRATVTNLKNRKIWKSIHKG